MPEWQYIEVDGINTRYRESGDGPAILLLHGGEMGSGGADTWPDELISGLDKDHRVVALDRLAAGFTDNPPDDAAFRMSSVVNHVAAFCKQLSIQDATLCGQSRGAYVALRLAMEHPELASHLVIVNSASISVKFPAEPVPGTRTYDTYYNRFTGDERQDAEIMSVTHDHITDAWVAAREESTQLPKRIESKQAFRRVWPDLFAEFEIEKAEVLKWVISGQHDKPTLLIWGVGDPTTTASDGMDLFEVMAPHVPQLRLHMINRCGHWPHREYPTEVASEIRQFITLP